MAEGSYRGLPSSTRTGIDSAVRFQSRPSTALQNAFQMAAQMGQGNMGSTLDDAQYGGGAASVDVSNPLPFGSNLPTAGYQGADAIMGNNPAPINIGDWQSQMPAAFNQNSGNYGYESASRLLDQLSQQNSGTGGLVNETVGFNQGSLVPGGFQNTPNSPYGQGLLGEALPIWQASQMEKADQAERDRIRNSIFQTQTYNEGQDTRDMQDARMQDFLNGVSQLSPEEQARYSREAEDLQTAMDRLQIQKSDSLDSLARQKGDLYETYGIESPYLEGQIARENERWNLAEQNIRLQLEGLEVQLQLATEGLDSTVANRAAVQGSFDWRQGFVDPQYENAVGAARNMLAEAMPASQQISADTQAAVGTTYEDATARTLGLKGQEIDPAAAAALTAKVGDQKGLFDQLFAERGVTDQKLLGAQQKVAVGQAGYEKIADLAKNERERTLTDAQFAVQERDDQVAQYEAGRQLSVGRVSAKMEELGHRDALAGLKNRKNLLDLNLSQNVDAMSEKERELKRDTGWMLEDLIQGQERNGLDRQQAEDAAMAEYMSMDAADYATTVTASHFDRKYSQYSEGFRNQAAGYVDSLITQGYETPENIKSIVEAQDWPPEVKEMVVEGVATYMEATRQFGLDEAASLSKSAATAASNVDRRNFDESTLVAIGGGSGRLARPAAQGWELARQAAMSDRVTLDYSDTYRSYNTQAQAYATFKATYNPRTGQGLNLAGNYVPSIASPEGSKHTAGTAVDIKSQSAITWMKQNGAKYGWANTVKSEPWHWEYVGVK